MDWERAAIVVRRVTSGLVALGGLVSAAFRRAVMAIVTSAAPGVKLQAEIFLAKVSGATQELQANSLPVQDSFIMLNALES